MGTGQGAINPLLGLEQEPLGPEYGGEGRFRRGSRYLEYDMAPVVTEDDKAG